MKKVLITSALPYANGPLHFGHIAGAYLPADVFARFMRLQGNEVLFLCGSDEYGVAITMSADLANRTPEEQVQLFHTINSEFFQTLGISFDHYSRTTWKGHTKPVQEYFLDLYKNGYIKQKETEQLYSENDQKFLADRYVVGTCPKCGFEEARGDECTKCASSFEATDLIKPRSKVTGASLSLKKTKHYFLQFDKFKDDLTSWIKSKNWKSNVTSFALNFIKDLKERAITRDSNWGVPIPLPDTDGKVLYVWFDAPIGYISASMDWASKTGSKDAWKEYWLNPDTKYVQFIGKDNIPFHSIFFPAMTMGQNKPYKLVDDLCANEFFNLEGKQFSKSANWSIDLESFFKQFTSDQIRYAIAANAPESQDSEFTWKDFQMRCNSELLGKYGNLVNRVLVFTKRYLDQKVPSKHTLDSRDSAFKEEIDTKVKEASDAFSTYHLRLASQIVMELAACSNRYFDEKKPWALAKDPSKKSELETTIHLCIYALKALALISNPIIPNASRKVADLIGVKLENGSWNALATSDLPTGSKIAEPVILFHKVEDDVIKVETEKLKKGSSLEKEDNLIDFDAFKKVDIRVGKVISVEKLPKSNKLLKFQIDLGSNTRQVLSGIAKHYPDPTVLIGKNVAVVTNLKPVKMMGELSEGMLLSYEIGKTLQLVHPKDGDIGSSIA